MKNRKIFLILAALMIAVSITAISCNRDALNAVRAIANSIGSGSSDDGSGGGASILTITELPGRGDSSISTWQVSVYKTGTNLSTKSAIESNRGLAATQSLEAMMDAETYNETGIPNVFPLLALWEDTYRVSGNRPVAVYNSRYSKDWDSQSLSVWYAIVNFSNGSATVPFSSLTLVYTEEGAP